MRIVCLSAESADICARLGAWDEVVGVTAFASQTGLARRPVVSGFSTADVAAVVAMQPDLVITFCDVQADLAAQLIHAGCTVLATNQRSLAQIGQAIRLIGGAIGRASAAEVLASEFAAGLETLRRDPAHRPRVYFEEWPEPLISGIGWVGELIELCGGEDIFASRRGGASRERVVSAEEVIAADPGIILASWCGKPVRVAEITRRPGWDTIAAVRTGQVHALPSSDLLQPGPALLAGGLLIRGILRGGACGAVNALPPRGMPANPQDG